eukprot:352470-Chlamydomonas_euryale.AAC.6
MAARHVESKPSELHTLSMTAARVHATQPSRCTLLDFPTKDVTSPRRIRTRDAANGNNRVDKCQVATQDQKLARY